MLEGPQRRGGGRLEVGLRKRGETTRRGVAFSWEREEDIYTIYIYVYVRSGLSETKEKKMREFKRLLCGGEG